jgi:hypothetical protein
VFASETQRLAEGDVEDGRITTRVRGSNDGITTDGSRHGALNNVTADMVRSPTSADRDIPGPDGETASSTIVFQASDDTATDDTVRDWNDPDATGSVQERPQRTPNTPLEEPKRSTGDVEASVWWDEESIGADRGNDAGSDSSSSTTSTPGSDSPSDASESGGDAESTSDSSDDTANDSPRDDPDDNPTDEADDKAEGEEGEKDTADSANESSSDRDDHDSTESVKRQRRRVLIAEARASSRETSAEQTQDQGQGNGEGGSSDSEGRDAAADSDSDSELSADPIDSSTPRWKEERDRRVADETVSVDDARFQTVRDGPTPDAHRRWEQRQARTGDSRVTPEDEKLTTWKSITDGSTTPETTGDENRFTRVREKMSDVTDTVRSRVPFLSPDSPSKEEESSQTDPGERFETNRPSSPDEVSAAQEKLTGFDSDSDPDLEPASESTASTDSDADSESESSSPSRGY